ncbi:hypothetical protein EDD11_006020 [Mortierella claussenii]|nr:hypothetical protein EDD11_006020 [Mortierella claussenii]
MRLAKSILLLLVIGTVTLSAVRHNDEAVVSSARLTDPDTTHRHHRGQDIFKNPCNHATAVASVLLSIAQRHEFLPREKGVILDGDVYVRFLESTIQFSAFSQSHKRRQDTLDLTGDRDQFRETIRDHYYTSHNDKMQVAGAFERLVPLELNQDHDKDETISKPWRLIQMTIINQLNNPIRIELAQVRLSLSRDNDGIVEINEQRAEMTVDYLEVDTAMLVEHAKEFSKDIPTVNTQYVLDEFSTYSKGLSMSEYDELARYNEFLARLKKASPESYGQHQLDSHQTWHTLSAQQYLRLTRKRARPAVMNNQRPMAL